MHAQFDFSTADSLPVPIFCAFIMLNKVIGLWLLALCCPQVTPQHYGHARSYTSLVHHHGQGYQRTPIVYQPVGHHPGNGGHPVQIAPAYHSSPAIHKGPHHEGHFDAHPQYQFKYGVEDHKTGDFKTHQETRDGDVVRGEYSVHEPDGTILTVQYTADKHSGFNAVVHRTGQVRHPSTVAVKTETYHH